MNTVPALSAPTSRAGSIISPSPTEDAAPVRKPSEPTDAIEKGAHAGKAEKSNVPGVIRLLEAGHFKGVADVRLRINFHEELSARAAERAGAELSAGLDGLVQVVGKETNALVASLALDEPTAAEVSGLLAGFEEAMQVEAERATTTGAINPDALGASLSSAFADFTAALSELLGSSGPDPKAADPIAATAYLAPVDVKDEPTIPENEIDPALTDPVVDPLEALTGAFQAALTELLDAVNQTSVLPEPSAPHGNGVAYAKFLAIYNELRGMSEAPALDVEG